MISFYILSKRFVLKHEGLSDARVASITKKEYGFAVHVLQRYRKSAKSISDEWLSAICCSSHLFGISIMKEGVAFSPIFFGHSKISETNTREMFSFLPLTNNSVVIELSYWVITKYISNHIIKNN